MRMSKPPGIIWLQWHDNPEPTWERDNIHEDDVKYGLYSEIERLQALVEELEKIRTLYAESTELQCKRIVALEDELAESYKDVVQAHSMDLSQIEKDMQGLAGRHWITEEMIDAAWKYHTNYQAEDILNKLHIFRCEGCGGGGTLGKPGWDNRCSSCDGNGWIIK